MPRFFFLMVLLLTFTDHRASAQEEIDRQLWLDYDLRVDLRERNKSKVHSLGGDAGIRGFISNQEWNQFYIRPTFTYRLRRVLSFSGAAAFFGTVNRDTTNSNEVRFHQEIFARFPETEFFTLFYRIRLEERFFNYENSPSDQEVRIRGLIGIESPDIHLGKGRRPFYFQFFWESFRNLSGPSASEVFINQARPTLVFAHRLSPEWRYEINLVAQSSKEYSDEGLETTQYLFRFRLFHRIFKKENSGNE